MLMVPYKLLLSSLSSGTKGDCVTIPASLLGHLLRLALASAELDEVAYLQKNPDVAAAVRSGDMTDGKQHFVTAGYFEGRSGVGLDVSEAWYVKSNPDVARAIVLGEWTSGEAHYNDQGLLEWRAPNKAAEHDLAAWKEILRIPDQPNTKDDKPRSIAG